MPRLRRRIRFPLLVAAAALALVMLVVLASALAVALGLTLDARPWREPVAQAIGRAMAREVVIDGAAEIELSLRPALHVGGIRIANPPGYSVPLLASLGESRLRLDLLSLLKGRLRVLDISARDAHLHFELLPDGRANWRAGVGNADSAASAPGVVTTASAASVSSATAGAATGQAELASLAIDRLLFERVTVDFRTASGSLRTFALDRLDTRAASGEPLTVRMDGRVEGRFEYTVDLRAGPLGTLLAANEPWPLKLDLAFAKTTLRLEGELFRLLEHGHADLRLALQTDDLSQIEELLQVRLPPVGATRLTTRFRWQPGLWQLDEIDGSMGDTQLQGRLMLASTGGAKPRLSGDLKLPVLDLRPFTGRSAQPATPPASLLDTYRELQSQRFDLRRLNDLDIDLELAVGRWQSLPGDVRDARLQLWLQDGALFSPIGVQVAGVPMSGALRVDSRSETPTFSLALDSVRHPLGGLARLFAGLNTVEGEVERTGLRLAAQGATPGDLVRSLSVAVSLDRARLSYGNRGGAAGADVAARPGDAGGTGDPGRPVEFRLDRFEASMPAGGALTGRASGALLEEPFDAAFSAGTLPDLARGAPWPLKLRLDASGARLAIDGQYGALGAGRDVDLSLSLDAPRAGSVARWLGLAPGAAVPLHLGGRVMSRAGGADLRLSDFRFDLGRSRLAGEFRRVATGGARPLLQVRMDADEVDVAELQSLLPDKPAAGSAPSAPSSPGLTLELPILPFGIDLQDSDLALNLRHLQLPAVRVTDIRFDAAVREGRIAAAPFSASVAGTAFSGHAGLDLRGPVPELALQLAARQVDVGALLKSLRVADDVDAQVDALTLALTLRGGRLGELLARSDLSADMQGGRWTPRDPAGRPLIGIEVARVRVEAPPGAPLGLTLDGAIDGNAVSLQLDSASLSEIARIASQPGGAGRVPLRLLAQAAGTRLELDGQVPLSTGQGNGELKLSLSGERLDSLDRLARTSLPPWGPWSIAGRFAERGRRYEMPELALRVGDSRLDGRGAIDFSAARPRIEIGLNAPQIQLDDFALRGWSAVTPAVAPPAAGNPADEDPRDIRARARAAAQQGQRLLARDTLLRVDAEVAVEVAQVLSSSDRLGNGRLQATLQDARLTVDPVEVQIPGGGARVAVTYEPLPGDREVQVEAQTRIDRFDYALLARRLKPGTEVEGRVSLDLQLAATGPLDALMPAANGHIDFTVWPVNLLSGVFDLWAVNLFVALLPSFGDGASASRVNCAVGHFDVRDGVLTHDKMIVDTSRMRVGGTARVDFRDESVAVRMQPRPKRAQFFSIAAPVEVAGHVSDFKIGVPPDMWFGTVIRFLTSVVTTPFEMAIDKPLPPDGSDVCSKGPRDRVGLGTR